MSGAMRPESGSSGPIAETDLCAWLAQASPGEALEYHCGFLILDRTRPGTRAGAEVRRELIRTSDRAMRLADLGLVHLVQRRLGDQRFSYLAIARPRSGRVALPSSILLAEAAA